MAVKARADITIKVIKEIDSCYRYYLLQSSFLAAPDKPSTFPPGGNWKYTEQTYTEGSTNSLYFVDYTKYSDGSGTYSEVSLSSAFEAAKIAYNKAVAAKDTADSKNSVFYSADAPTAKKINDIWFDTDDDNKIYRWNGSEAGWVASELGDNAISSLSATKLTAGTIDASEITVSNLNAGNITSGTLSAERIASGSLAIGKLSSDAQAVISGKADKIYHTMSGGGNTASYFKFATFVISGSYMNKPVSITVVGRGNQPSTVWFQFENKNSSDPGLAYIKHSGSIVFYINKLTTSTWDLYLKKSESYDTLSVTGYINTNVKISCTWSTDQVTDLPEDAVRSSLTVSTATWCYDNNISYLDGANIYAGTVTAEKIAANSLTASQIMAGTITANELASNCITTEKINSSAITTGKIAADAITSDKILAGAVTADEIASGAVTTNAIAANAVTAGKIETGSINAAHIDGGAITGDWIKAGSITAEHMAANSITVGKMSDDTKEKTLNSNIEVGAKNMLLDSDKSNASTVTDDIGEYGSTLECCARYYLTGKVEAGESYVFSVKLSTTDDIYSWNVFFCDEDKNSYGIGWVGASWNTEIVAGLDDLDRNDAHFTYKQFTATSEMSDCAYIELRCSNHQNDLLIGGSEILSDPDIEGECLVFEAQLEKGNVATDWALAQEDLVDADTYAETTENVSKIDGIISNWAAKDSDGETDYTYINGGNITTGSISADCIIGDTLASIRANLGEVTTGKIKSPDYDSGSGVMLDFTGGETNDGLYVKSSTKNTTLKIDSDGTRVYGTDMSHPVAEFVNTGVDCDHVNAESAVVAGLSFSNVGGEVWVTIT